MYMYFTQCGSSPDGEESIPNGVLTAHTCTCTDRVLLRIVKAGCHVHVHVHVDCSEGEVLYMYMRKGLGIFLENHEKPAATWD